MTVINKEILLLKAQGGDGEDKYDSLLTQNGYTVKHLQVLDFQYVHLSVLKEKLDNAQNYTGIIFTSPRAVIATKMCLNGNEINASWKEKNNFVIGEATHDLAYKELDLNCRGQESGNANNLSELIVKEQFNKPFLFPCGNLKRETLGKRLSENNILLDATMVYETVRSTRLDRDLNELTANFKNMPEYIVYFSPSGVKFTVDTFRDAFVDLSDIKLVAIGPSTKEAIESEKLTVHSVALKPTETELLHAISKNT